MAQQLRARFDVILVVEQDGKAVQFDFATNLRDHFEMAKRFPKAAEEPSTATFKLIWCAAQRVGISPEGEAFDAWVDRVLDVQLDELPPLVKG